MNFFRPASTSSIKDKKYEVRSMLTVKKMKTLSDGTKVETTETTINPSTAGGVKGAGAGAATGAAIGAIVGGPVGAGVGAAIGAVAGGITGFIFGPAD